MRLIAVALLGLFASLDPVSAQVGFTSDLAISWEVKSRFRLFRYESDFLKHVDADRGDGILAAFDSASDGVAAAVAMQQAVYELGRRSRLRLAIRVGLSAGDVSWDDGDCFGLPVVDRIFGTAYLPRDRRPRGFGIPDPVPPIGYLQHLAYPFTAAARTGRA